MSKKKFPVGDGIVYSTDPGFAGDAAPEVTETPAPALQLLRVSLDTKHRGGKAVTLVTGFAGREEDLESLGKQLKNHCGTGGSVKDGQVIIQGDQQNKVSQWLQAKGYKVGQGPTGRRPSNQR
jgi:translation initiation factor 1